MKKLFYKDLIFTFAFISFFIAIVVGYGVYRYCYYLN